MAVETSQVSKFQKNDFFSEPGLSILPAIDMEIGKDKTKRQCMGRSSQRNDLKTQNVKNCKEIKPSLKIKMLEQAIDIIPCQCNADRSV